MIGTGAERLEIRRSPRDLLFLYTGGTTGMPKGVMWEQSALFRSIGGGGNAVLGERASGSVEEQRARIRELPRSQRLLPGSPLMHGTGLFTSFNALGGGGSVVTLRSRSLDPEELWSTVEVRGVQALTIVGDAFAQHMLRALETHGLGKGVSDDGERLHPSHFDGDACQ